ncbi:hypothetical protein Lfu02_78740 [Longispora fulva]|nr:hypothetical protein Lfu02_78740 [Longispora fulva]
MGEIGTGSSEDRVEVGQGLADLGLEPAVRQAPVVRECAEELRLRAAAVPRRAPAAARSVMGSIRAS